MKIGIFTVTGVVARLLKLIAYRKTTVATETKGHSHWLFSVYLTDDLGLRSKTGQIMRPQSETGLTLWLVPPFKFHEWVTLTKGAVGNVWDLTPLHKPHILA